MRESALLPRIGRKDIDKEQMAKRVAKNCGLVSEVLKGLRAKKAAIKYGCARVLRVISEQQPEVVYPYINSFVDLLSSENNIMKWEGIHVIGNLAAVDKENKIDELLGKYLAPIRGAVMITAANVMGGAAKIALAKPHLAERIAREIVRVEHAEYKTPECRNVALGHAIKSFDRFFEHIENREPVIDLIRKQLDNPRDSTRKKAEKFLKKWGC